MSPRLAALAVLMLGWSTLPASATAYSFVQVDYPGSTGTVLTGVNDAGVIVGNYSDSVLPPGSFNPATNGFVDVGGTFTVVTLPGVTGPVNAQGINNAGTVVGSYFLPLDPFGLFVGYVKAGSSVTTFNLSDYFSTSLLGISNNGQVVGGLAGAGHYSPTFIIDAAGSVVFLPFPTGFYPTALYPNVDAVGVNDAGIVVGLATGFTETLSDAFIYQNGMTTLFDVPSSFESEALGINDAGQIVGAYQDSSSRQFGFIDTSGVFQTITAPGSTYTRVSGINNLGEIVGSYSDATGQHGFYALPQPVPEPASLAIFGAATSVLAFVRWRRRRRVSARAPRRTDAAAPALAGPLALLLPWGASGGPRRMAEAAGVVRPAPGRPLDGGTATRSADVVKQRGVRTPIGAVSF